MNDFGEMNFKVRWRRDDKDSWKESDVMTKTNADENVSFLTQYGYIAKTIVC